MTALEDRRQAAREAGQDAYVAGRPLDYSPQRGIDAAIEAATRVRVTPEIIEAAASSGRGFGFNIETAIRAAFEAAGFEVES